MADKKVSELASITNLSGDDLLLVVNDPSGTPTSNKVTVSNLFANVVPNAVYKGNVTHRGNELNVYTGSMDVSANATFSGTLNVTGSLVESGISTRSGVQIFSGNTIHNDTLFANGGVVISSSVSSGGSNIIGKNGNLNANNAIADGTITDAMLVTNIDDYMQVANTNALVTDRIQVANASLLINDRMQVANTVALHTSVTANLNSYIANTEPRLTVLETVVDVSINSVSVSANTGLRLSGRYGDPASSNASTEGIQSGTVFYSNTYLYIATDENTIKRITLESF